MDFGVDCKHCGEELKLDLNEHPPGTAYTCPNCEGACMVSPAMVGPGVTLDDFTIVRLLGKGGMGEVYLARQNSMDREVALKVLPVAFSSQKDYVSRFRQEVRMAARLKHPNIVRAYKAGEVGGIHFLAMDYVEGESVKERLKRQGPYKEGEALEIIDKLAAALGQIWDKHQMIHRDIKPDNIMIDEYGEPLLMDMGLSKIMDGGDGVSMPGSVLGTPNYMSPEQAQSKPDLDFQSDMYSLGVTLHHMLTGTMPFYGSSVLETLMRQVEESLPDPRESNPHVSDRTVAIMRRMLAKERQDRFSSWQELRECLSGKPVAMPQGAEDAGFSSLMLSADDSAALQQELAASKKPKPTRRRAGKAVAASAQPQASPAAAVQPPARQSAVLPWVIAGVATLALILVIALSGRQPDAPAAAAESTTQQTTVVATGESASQESNTIANNTAPSLPSPPPATPKVQPPAAAKPPTPLPTTTGARIVTAVPGAPGDKMVTRLEMLQQVVGGSGGISALAISPDGKLLASGDKRGGLIIWDIATMTRQALLKGSSYGISGVAFSSDGSLLAAAGRTMDLRTFDVRSGKLMHALSKSDEHQHSYMSVVFLPGDKRLLAGSSKSAIDEWDVETGALIRSYKAKHHVWGMDLSPDNTKVASFTWDGGVKIWGVADPITAIKDIPTRSSNLYAMAFSADGKKVYTGGNATKVFEHSVETETPSRQVADLNTRIGSVDASPDGSWIVAMTIDSDEIYLINAKTRRVVVAKNGEGHGASEVVFFPNTPSRFVTGGGDATLAIWEIQSVPESLLLKNQPAKDPLVFKQEVSHDYTLIPPWQTFTATVDGFLSKLDIAANMYQKSGGRLRVYQGDGIRGPVVHEMQWTVTEHQAERGWMSVELGEQVPMQKGAVYTWELTGAGGISYAKNNPYPDGRASMPSYDMCFRMFFTESP